MISEVPTAGQPLAVGRQARSPAQLVTDSPAMHEVERMARRLADLEFPVLISGEPGSGKRLIANHLASYATQGVVRCVSGSAFGSDVGGKRFDPERAEQYRQRLNLELSRARGGVLLVVEIADLAIWAQRHLAERLLQDALLPAVERRRLGTPRLIATTRHDLGQRYAEGLFSAALLQRLSAITIAVPPLRQRREDIRRLSSLFAAESARACGNVPPVISPSAHAALVAGDWPDNVRQLRLVIEEAVFKSAGQTIDLAHLPPDLCQAPAVAGRLELTPTHPAPGDDAHDPQGSHSLETLVQRYEMALIYDALRRSAGNQSLAARLLSIPRRTLVHKMTVGRFGRDGDPLRLLEPEVDGLLKQGQLCFASDDLPFRQRVRRYGGWIAEKTLLRFGDRRNAAQILGVSVRTLNQRIRRYRRDVFTAGDPPEELGNLPA